MKLFEYQAKELFKEAGIPVPAARLVENGEELDAALDITGLPSMLKAQVLQGGRGKAGLIQLAASRDECHERMKKMFEGPQDVRKILVEQAISIEKELYLAVTVDPVSGKALIIGSSEGGVEIEELAVRAPGKIIRRLVDITQGIMPYQLRGVMFEMGFKGDVFKQGIKILKALFDVFLRKGSELAEINPLVQTSEGRLIAVDGKFSIDDNSMETQEGIKRTRDQYGSDIEFEAAEASFPYLSFDGDIGLLCAGAGLTNTVYDLIIDNGGTVSNYLEFGGPNYRRAVEAMEFTLRSNPKVILVVTFGTIARADVMAEGLAEAIKKLKPSIPIVTAIRGTNEEKAAKVLKDLGLKPLNNTEKAVKAAISLCRESG